MFAKIQYQHEKLGRCRWWIDRGFHICLAQVDKKFLLAGWGEYQQRIKTFDDAVLILDRKSGRLNIAVVAPHDAIVLDFDDAELYARWIGKHPEYAQTYTERTPRGGAHVFLRGIAPAGLCLVQGVERKRVCLVNPSTVYGRSYIAGTGEILAADPVAVFSSLSKIGTKSAYLLQIEQNEKTRTRSRSGLIEQIKAHWNTVQVFQTYRPDIEFYKSGAVLVARCPFHEDHRPSMFVNPTSGFWKCHACGASGDVINAYARLQGIENRDAVARMAAVLAVSS